MGACASSSSKHNTDAPNRKSTASEFKRQLTQFGTDNYAVKYGTNNSEFGSSYSAPTTTIRTGNHRESVQILSEMRRFRDEHLPRLQRDHLLTPRTMFKEVYAKSVDQINSYDISILRTYIKARKIEWAKEEKAAIKLQSLWRGEEARVAFSLRQVQRQLEAKLKKQKEDKSRSYQLAGERSQHHRIMEVEARALVEREINNEKHHTMAFDYMKQPERPKFTEAFNVQKNLEQQYGAYAMTRKAANFFIHGVTAKLFHGWRDVVADRRKLDISAVFFFRQQFRWWHRRSKKRIHDRNLFGRVERRHVLQLQRAYLIGWWKRTRHTYEIRETAVTSNQSKYRVIVEKSGLMAPTETKMTLLSVEYPSGELSARGIRTEYYGEYRDDYLDDESWYHADS
jgi:hypothetical protein